MKKVLNVLVIVAISIAALALTGCAGMEWYGTPTAANEADPNPQVYPDPASEVTFYQEDDSKKVSLTEDNEADWEVFQETYQLALLDAQNGGSVWDRAEWESYWYEAPTTFKDAGMTKEAAQAARMSLEILEAGGDPEYADATQLSELQLLAGTRPKK